MSPLVLACIRNLKNTRVEIAEKRFIFEKSWDICENNVFFSKQGLHNAKTVIY